MERGKDARVWDGILRRWLYSGRGGRACRGSRGVCAQEKRQGSADDRSAPDSGSRRSERIVSIDVLIPASSPVP